jgi:hypothetical protein
MSARQGQAELRPPRVLARSSVERGIPRATQPPTKIKQQAAAPATFDKGNLGPRPTANAATPAEQSLTVQKVAASEINAGDALTTLETFSRPTAKSQVDGKPAEENSIELNLAELNARIGGYHDGLDELEAAIVAADGPLNEKAAARLVERLEELAGQYAFVTLYYEALTSEEREFVAAPRSMTATLDLVSQQCRGLEDADTGDFLGSSDDNSRSKLGERLDAVAKAVRGEAADNASN